MIVSSGDETFVTEKMVSALKDNSLTFPLEIDRIQKPIYFKTAQHKQKYKKEKLIVRNVLGSLYFQEK